MKLSIKKLILLFFGIILTLSLINYFTIRFYKMKQESDSAVINAAGRNRTLSQQIPLFALLAKNGSSEAVENLKNTIRKHHASLNALKSGGIAPGIANNTPLPAASQEIMPRIKAVENLWKQYKNKADIVVKAYEGGKPSAEEIKQILAALSFLENNAEGMLKLNNDLVSGFVGVNEAKQAQLDSILLLMLGLNVLFIAVGYYFFDKLVLKRISKLAKTAENIAQGNLDEDTSTHADPALRSISHSVNALGKIIDRSVKFATELGNGNFKGKFKKEELSNRLYSELNSMRKKLAGVAEEDKKRQWVSNGLASLGDILRQNQHDIKELGDEILTATVKYVKANQGGLFILNEQQGEEFGQKNEKAHMEMLACYAWDRKKFVNQTIERGEGMVGQCWIEGKTIYMTDIPENYVNITSGLGKANPQCLVLVPLINNEEVLGVLELASFEELDENAVELIEKIATSIASTLANARTNARTRKLLESSQEQAEVLRAQEEEMRQNMEELSATQEEMSRKEKEYVAKIEDLEAQIETLNEDTEHKTAA